MEQMASKKLKDRETPRVSHLRKELASLNSQLEKLQNRTQPSLAAAPEHVSPAAEMFSLRTDRNLHQDDVIAKDRVTELEGRVGRLLVENEKLRQKNARLHNLEAELSKMRVKSTPTRTPVPAEGSLTPRIRNDALQRRLKEVESENLELKRNLAGLTPKVLSEMNGGERCADCRRLRKQKARHDLYMEKRLVSSREAQAAYRDQVAQLTATLDSLQAHVTQLQSNYQEQLDKLRNRASVYKGRSERLERLNRAHMKGFRSDVKLLRDKIGAVERDVLKSNLLAWGNDL